MLAVRAPRIAIESVLDVGLSAYRAAIGSVGNVAPLVEACGLQCHRCGDGRCARLHGFRRRKRVTDLSTGEMLENLPVRRVLFCDGTSGSLVPAEIWRGRFTITSVVETVVQVHGRGVKGAAEWADLAGTGEEMVSERTLRRWRDLVATRLIGSAFSWLGPKLGLSWSEKAPVAAQLETLLERLTSPLLLGFRALTGRALLDKPTPVAGPARSTAPRVLGRLTADPPHTPPSSRRPRGSWWPRRSREAPGPDAQEQRPPPQKEEPS